MSVTLTIAAGSYLYPEDGEENWGTIATDAMVAVCANALWGTGGEIDYLVTSAANPAQSGKIRFANSDDGLAWRNGTNTADLLLDVASNRLRWAGNQLSYSSEIIPLISPVTTGNVVMQKADGTLEDGGVAAADLQTAATVATQLYTGVCRQAIINGALTLWQRGTSFDDSVAPATGLSFAEYNADRWAYERHETAESRVTISKESSVVPTGHVAAIKVDCTTAESALAAAEYAFLRYRVEGYDFAPYVGQTAVLSFWVRATTTGTFGIAFRNSGKDRRLIKTATIAAANTYQQVSLSVTFDYSGGTWNLTSGVGLEVDIVLMAGTDHQGTADAWASDSKLTTSAQTNFLDSAATNFYVAGIMLHRGTALLPFAYSPITEEVEKAQRYYEKSYALDDAPGTVYAATAFNGVACTGTLSVPAIQSVVYRTRKRAAGTFTIRSQAGTADKMTENIAGFPDVSVSFDGQSVGSEFASAAFSGSGHGGTPSQLIFHYTCDAEL